MGEVFDRPTEGLIELRWFGSTTNMSSADYAAHEGPGRFPTGYFGRRQDAIGCLAG